MASLLYDEGKYYDEYCDQTKGNGYDAIDQSAESVDIFCLSGARKRHQ